MKTPEEWGKVAIKMMEDLIRARIKLHQNPYQKAGEITILGTEDIKDIVMEIIEQDRLDRGISDPGKADAEVVERRIEDKLRSFEYHGWRYEPVDQPYDRTGKRSVYFHNKELRETYFCQLPRQYTEQDVDSLLAQLCRKIDG